MRFRLIPHSAVWTLLILVLVLSGCSQNSDPVATDARQPSTGGSSGSGPSTLDGLQIIESHVSEMRGLDSKEPVGKAFLNTDELRQKMIEDVAEDYSEQEAHDDALLYAAFELMDPDIDLYDLLIDLYTEQVAGFYDPDEKEMFVVRGDQALAASERLVYAHEYTHVLQDQHFDLQALGFTDDDDDEKEDAEKDFAVRSLVEGDASLLMQQYALQKLTADDLKEILSESESIDMDVLDRSPAIVRESLMFPYQAGQMFAMTLFNDGGWSAVDAAYKDPPVSTEQILHPERYPGDVPQIVTLPPLTDTLGAGWRLVDENVLGEFGIQQYLKVHTDDGDVEVAAEGWGGDRYAVHWREDESAFVLVTRLVWDSPGDADEFFETYTRFAEERFGGKPARSEGDTRLWWFGEDALLLARNDQDETLIIIAPNETTLDEIYALFQDFQ
jgi:hypothetical protein